MDVSQTLTWQACFLCLVIKRRERVRSLRSFFSVAAFKVVEKWSYSINNVFSRTRHCIHVSFFPPSFAPCIIVASDINVHFIHTTITSPNHPIPELSNPWIFGKSTYSFYCVQNLDLLKKSHGKHRLRFKQNHITTFVSPKKLTKKFKPPKRKAGGPSTAPKPRQSKLAKEHNVSAQEEGEIKEAFGLFAEPMDGEKNGVLPINDVKSALM